MIPGRLFERFDLLGDAPETIEQLRRLVVVLAITGRLESDLQQPPNTASLLELLQEARRGLAKRGVAINNVGLEVSVSELPATFANADQFVRLGFLARIEKGPTGIKAARPGHYPLVVTGAERSTCDHFDFEGAATIVPLVSSAGHGKASLNRLHYQEGKFALGSILAAVLPYAPDLISARFLFEYLSAFKDELLVSRMTGTANVTLTVARIATVPVPLISLATQRKIDELMTLCDRLEAARNQREQWRD
ncbi:MAG: hypothetical protein KA142_13595 [Chromatiaceae bacterium]|nr:hypothetical protein [Chromatiaceae bacterium]MBP9603095.1 hypothetical protein [Chromatiaceae bacterium]